jgi:glucose-6-phosphate isomerase
VSDRDLTVAALLPPDVAPAVEELVRSAEEQKVAERLRDGDPTLWGPAGTPELADRLGWLTIAERMRDELPQIEELVAEVIAEGIGDVVLLGMGGSSLAPEVLRRTFPPLPEHPRLHVLDSTDPAAIAAVEEAVEPARTLFIVSSKSGGTIEPNALMAYFWERVPNGSNFIAITDPGSSLAELAAERRFRRTFYGDPEIGGRYSALSPFGIVPGTLIGAPVEVLLSGAARAWATPVSEQQMPAAVWLGATLAALARGGRDKLTFLIPATLPGLGLWLEQLVAESTGKQGTGILPVAEEPLGEAADYGPDRVFVALLDPSSPDAADNPPHEALAGAGHPLITIPTTGPEDLGRLFMLAELAVAVAGWGLGINPFDQPNVQQAKDATRRVLEEYAASGRLPELGQASQDDLRELLLGAGPPSYVALMGYLRPSVEFDSAVAELRTVIRAASRATTTFGYGPRFLHSTGQFHKGGPRTGRFLQLLHDGRLDLPIPGGAGGADTFGTLKEAQAIGDLQTLRELGLPAGRLRLAGDDPVSALGALTDEIRGWT